MKNINLRESGICPNCGTNYWNEQERRREIYLDEKIFRSKFDKVANKGKSGRVSFMIPVSKIFRWFRRKKK
jgi:hypothetical protein